MSQTHPLSPLTPTPCKVRLFRVFRASENANAFGLHGYWLLDKRGNVFEVSRSRGPHLNVWEKDDTVEVSYVVTESGKDSFQWHYLNVECPTPKPAMPAHLIREIWG